MKWKHIKPDASGVVALFVAGAAILLLLLICYRSPSPKPALAIGVLNMTNFGGPIFSVQVGITNIGGVAISYNPINFSPYAWVRIESLKGWSTNDVGPYRNAGRFPRLLEPGSNTFGALVLPPGTLRWQVGYKVRAASLRHRVTSHLPAGWRRIRTWVGWPFSNNEGPEQTIESPVFGPPHNEGGAVDAEFAPPVFQAWMLGTDDHVCWA
jgi:hypothetical protein